MKDWDRLCFREITLRVLRWIHAGKSSHRKLAGGSPGLREWCLVSRGCSWIRRIGQKGKSADGGDGGEWGLVFMWEGRAKEGLPGDFSLYFVTVWGMLQKL